MCFPLAISLLCSSTKFFFWNTQLPLLRYYQRVRPTEILRVHNYEARPAFLLGSVDRVFSRKILSNRKPSQLRYLLVP